MLQRQRTDSGIIHLYIGPCGDPADRRMTIMGRPGARGVQCESHVATHLLGPPRCCLTHVGSSPAFCGTGLWPSSRKPALRTYGFHYVDPPFFSLPAANGRLLEVRQQQDHPRRYTMQNCAEFQIIGRVGKVDPKEKVTHLDVAANYPRRDGEGWKDDRSEEHTSELQSLMRTTS